MAVFRNMTRGGQVHIHQLRMIRQVLWFALLVGFCASAGHFSIKAYRVIPSWLWQMMWEYHVAELNLITQPDEKKPFVKQQYAPPRGAAYERTSLSIVRDRAIRERVLRAEAFLTGIFRKSLITGFLAFFLALIGWSVLGHLHRRKEQHRGNKIVSPRTLARKLKWTFRASDLRLGKLPLVKDKETSHILISGTTGSGKSNAFHMLLPQIRARGQRAILVDLTGGSLVSRFYNPWTDLILNPFDERSQSWDPWRECRMPSHFEALAEAMIPQRKTHDPFWDDAGRVLLSVALQKLRAEGKPDISRVFSLLTQSSAAQFHDFFTGTEAATFADKQGERTTLSIRSNLARNVACFRYLPDTAQGFSLREWVSREEESSWLFLTARNDQRAALRSLLTAWIDIAFNALTTLTPHSERRLWFIIDELPGLHRIPSLGMALAEGRKYGGCVLAGLQSFPQLREIYGADAARAMLDQFNTQVFFRSTDPETTAWICKILGESEETEIIENLSYGANTMRDGVSLNQHTRNRPLVLPTEISGLRDLECFVKYPGRFPVARLRMAWQKATQHQTAFQIREGMNLPSIQKNCENLSVSAFPETEPLSALFRTSPEETSS